MKSTTARNLLKAAEFVLFSGLLGVFLPVVLHLTAWNWQWWVVALTFFLYREAVGLGEMIDTLQQVVNGINSKHL